MEYWVWHIVSHYHKLLVYNFFTILRTIYSICKYGPQKSKVFVHTKIYSFVWYKSLYSYCMLWLFVKIVMQFFGCCRRKSESSLLWIRDPQRKKPQILERRKLIRGKMGFHIYIYYKFCYNDIFLLTMLFNYTRHYQIDSSYTAYVHTLDIMIFFSDPNSIFIMRIYCKYWKAHNFFNLYQILIPIFHSITWYIYFM